ncbi:MULTISPECIES: NAD(P)H-binding protein [Streptomyces]|uniref:NAD(P)H-binding protein n=1 Tax=Streptomyces TaxID=1883 RepID=UPI003316A908
MLLLGIYDEVPAAFGRWNAQAIGTDTLRTYQAAADAITSSDLDYTMLRPAWLWDEDEIDYEVIARGSRSAGRPSPGSPSRPDPICCSGHTRPKFWWWSPKPAPLAHTRETRWSRPL